MRFFKTPALIKLVMPNLTWKVPNDENKIFLTFDDGPVAGVTDWVLDTLELFKIPATFFVVGENIGKHPQVFKRIKEGGHSVGNHTFNHLNYWKSSREDYVQNIWKCSKALGDVASKPMFRPPYGKISPSLSKDLSKEYRIIMWDVLSYDYDPDTSAEECLAKSVEHTRSGSIILFHDSYKTEKKLKKVLPAYLKKMQNEGFVFDRL